ncbi:MAG: sugar ABC transporter permease [Weizmannia coagulans]|nr:MULTISPECIES: sugar ABC transporter permease [Heyndrickxia]KGT37689.1 ABC transporter permease [Heyndrickxia coagulans P38]MCI1575311.1 sugar ABC transporter permease [Heyndrickxia coagulans]MED4313044.1 sugar ABC transporter permease [Heyndrickxia coagulans]MED4841482.1 sugar ABC transporter permease [Weizmannia sp. CD-2023]MED4902565.1 sugar ABC transporter permease [Weizmannia sp. CD-2023]
MKKNRLQAFLFILPALLIIGVFSLWPIFQSLRYTFFDYQLNNQQKSGLYMSPRYNFSLFDETQTYVRLFLTEDREKITDPADRQKADKLVHHVADVAKQYKGRKGVQKISKADQKKLMGLYTDSSKLVKEINAKYDTPNGKNLSKIVKDFKSSFVPSNFTGFKSYKEALHDKRLGHALWNTVLFTVVSVFLEFVLGLGLAMIMNKAFKGQGIVRTTSLIPWAIPTAVAALMWSYLYDGTSGVVAHFFQSIGLISDSRILLLTGSGAMVSTILADVWKTTPYMALLLLAGLQNISKGLYEAASIDGATKIQQFFKITLPMLKSSILVALLFRTLDAFRVFDLIYVLTGGGPGGATETMSVYGYKTMFGQTNFGYGSVIVIIMFICVAIIATIYIKVLGANLMDKN